jgi:hypothetical protein
MFFSRTGDRRLGIEFYKLVVRSHSPKSSMQSCMCGGREERLREQQTEYLLCKFGALQDVAAVYCLAAPVSFAFIISGGRHNL